jgi:hypothetical protein
MSKPSADKSTQNENPAQRRHRREKATIDHLVGEVHEKKPPEGHVQSPMTNSGLPVEEQVRKEWDPTKGGLPIF